MPTPDPVPLGARKARREHGQYLVAIPRALARRWAVGTQTLFYWTLLDDQTAALTRLQPPPPGRPWPIGHPMRDLPHDDTDIA